MKKLIAFAFVACMVSFAACTSKPAEEAVEDTTAIEQVMEPAMDTVAVDSAAADTAAAN
jgi:hypothetical protein